ncbi:MAG: hypothetical protein NUV77_26525 [Thermoguttaceae bacterium]|jgi:hypothetical protein|nr:hypothetical protein [Thermoguttaceae bacterium]
MTHMSGAAVHASGEVSVALGEREADHASSRKDSEQSARSRAFAIAYVLTCLSGLLAALAINLLGNGTGNSPFSHIPSVSERPWKARRLEELVNTNRAPEVLVLGSSKVMQVQPAYVEAITGMRTFNYGVGLGGPLDYLTILRYALQLGVKPRLLILGVDEFAFRAGINRYQVRHFGHWGLFRQLPFPERLEIACGAWKQMSVWTTLRGLRNLLIRRPKRSRTIRDVDSILLENGYLIYAKWALAKAEGKFSMLEEIRKAMDDQVPGASDDTDGYTSEAYPDAQQLLRFRQLLDLAAEHRIEVRVMLLPRNPVVERQISTPHRLRLRARLNEALRMACERHGFAYRDFTDIASFGGDPMEFWDHGHQTPANTRRMINTLFGIDPAKTVVVVPTDIEILADLPEVNTLSTE